MAFDLLLGFLGLLPWLVLLLIIILAFIKIIYEYQRGVVFTLGRYSGILQPGLRILIPFIQTYRRIDMRITTVDIPKQEVMTRDNVPVMVNAVVYFRVKDAAKSVIEIKDFHFAVAQYALTALRDVIGGKELDEVLSNRDEIAEEIEKIVDVATDPWGIDVTNLKIQDVELPADMKRVMAKQAEAEREKRAVIIKAQGEVIASTNLAKAAGTLSKTNGALHLRTLNTLNDLSSDQSNTVVFAVPLEVLRAFEDIGDYLKKKTAEK